MADGEALLKIFSNLLSNATQYAKSKVSIQLIPPKEGEHFLVVEIANDGFIIPKAMKEKIFEPFFRLKETVKQKGTGIGLALARSLAELHQGELYLKDKEEGQNVFVLKLPYASNLQKGNAKTVSLSSLMKLK